MEMDIIKHIKDLMEERGWTNYRLGKEAGLSQSTITNLFNRNNAPTIPTLEIAELKRRLEPFLLKLPEYRPLVEQLMSSNDST